MTCAFIKGLKMQIMYSSETQSLTEDLMKDTADFSSVAFNRKERQEFQQLYLSVQEINRGSQQFGMQFCSMAQPSKRGWLHIGRS